MENPTFKITRRTKSGKGTSRRLRDSGLVPGIIYGQEVEAPIPVSLDPKLLQKTLQGQFKRNTVLNIEVEGEKRGAFLAMVHDYQFHPVKRTILHVDFITVNPSREVQIEIPVRTTGKAAGVQKGGLLMEILHDLPITCMPDKIPVEVVVDVSALDIGQSLKVSDLQLPEGVKAALPPEQALVSVTTIKEEKEVVVAPEEAEAAEAAAAGEKKPEGEGEEKEEDKKGDKGDKGDKGEKKEEAKKGVEKKGGEKEEREKGRKEKKGR